MPIRADQRARYPDDWDDISRAVKDRAGWRCECRGECGRPYEHLSTDTRCVNVHGQPIIMLSGQPVVPYGRRGLVVLTTAHLDHTPENCDPANLRAFCQGCHLHYDRGHHAETRAATRAAELAATMSPLWVE